MGIESDGAFSEFLKSVGQFDHKILASGINTYLETKSTFLKPYPNVKSVLGKLKRKGVFLSIVTDAPKTRLFSGCWAWELNPNSSLSWGMKIQTRVSILACRFCWHWICSKKNTQRSLTLKF